MQAELEAIYHPPLDPALIAAIANDVNHIEEAKETLDVLQAEAIADGFEDGYVSPDFEFSEEDAQDSMTGSPDAKGGEDENLRFLRLSFPGQSITTLKFVLHKCHEDVLKSVDELLNHEMIDEERRLNAIVDGEISTMDDFYSGNLIRQQKKRKQKRQRGNLLQNELDPAVQSGKQQTSRWEQIGSEVEWMTKALGLPKSTVQSAYHANSSSLPAALNTLLERTDWEDHSSDPNHKENLVRMKKSHPSLGSNKVLEILNATREELPLANEVANVLAAWRPSIGFPSPAQTSLSSSSSISSTEPTRHATSTTLTIDLSVAARGMSTAQCRDMAAEFARKRDVAFRQAATAYQRSKSDGLQGGTAMHYSQVGRELDGKMRAWKMQAAQLSSVQKSGSLDDLDLHGLSVHESLVVVKSHLTEWYAHTRMLESGALVRPLRIVTGLGTHSAGGEARLLPAVKKFLERDGWRFEVSGGQVTVLGLSK